MPPGAATPAPAAAGGARAPGRRFDRVLLIVLDSAGIGDAPDADRFGDLGSNTLLHIHERIGLRMPTLAGMGLRRLLPLGPGPVDGAWGTMAERSAGKDTTSGHWEIAGGLIERAFPLFPEGFPPAVLDALEAVTGQPALCNRPASGTEVIERFGPEHLATGRPILYTSGDSVLQIAAHTDKVPVETLWAWCRAAREICRGPYEVGRIIARPFRGAPGAFARDQGNRRDYSIAPPPGLLPDALTAAGVPVHAIGKIEDIFCGVGIQTSVHTKDNEEGLAETIRAARERPEGLVFVNLVDFDALYGHRNDPAGYARALEAADAGIAELLPLLGPRDLLVLTADHGNDPTTKSTDHSRERVPLLCWWPGIGERALPPRETFADLGQTVADAFGQRVPHGTSFLDALA